MNSIFAELPFLINTQPEGSSFPVYLAASQQVSNFLLFFLYRFALAKGTRRALHGYTYALMAVAFVGITVLATDYDTTSPLGAKRKPASVLFFVVAVLLGLACGASNTVCWGFISEFPEIHTVAFSVGQGVSSAAVGVAAILQGNGTRKTAEGKTVNIMRYSVEAFFGANAFFTGLMAIAFTYLLYSSAADRERARQRRIAAKAQADAQRALRAEEAAAAAAGAEGGLTLNTSFAAGAAGAAKRGAGVADGDDNSGAVSPVPLLHDHDGDGDVDGTGRAVNVPMRRLEGKSTSFASSSSASSSAVGEAAAPSPVPAAVPIHEVMGFDLDNPKQLHLLRFQLWLMVPLALVAGCTYGFFPSVLSFGCLSYHRGDAIYLYANAVYYVADPLGRLGLAWPAFKRFTLRPTVWKTCVVLNILSTIIMLVIALQSPRPAGYTDPNGGALPIILTAIVSVTFAVAQTVIFIFFHQIDLDSSSLGFGGWMSLYNPSTKGKQGAGAAATSPTERHGLLEHASHSHQDPGSAASLAAPASASLAHDVEAAGGAAQGGGAAAQQRPEAAAVADDSRHASAEVIESTRAHMYKLAGMCIQLGTFILALSAFLLTVVGKVIAEPVER